MLSIDVPWDPYVQVDPECLEQVETSECLASEARAAARNRKCKKVVALFLVIRSYIHLSEDVMMGGRVAGTR